MLLIPCPYCGPRDEPEFRCGGESHVERPPLESADATWSDYLFVRNNPKGLNRERWHHTHGCRQWFNLVRNTATHAIVGSYAMGQPPAEFEA